MASVFLPLIAVHHENLDLEKQNKSPGQDSEQLTFSLKLIAVHITGQNSDPLSLHQDCGSAFIYADPDPDPAVFLNADPNPGPGPGPAYPNLKKKNHQEFS